MAYPPAPHPAPGLPKCSVVAEPSPTLWKITSSWGCPCARTAPTRLRPHGGPAPSTEVPPHFRGRGWPWGDAVGLWKSALGPKRSGAPSVGYPSGPHRASLPPSPARFKQQSPAPPPFHRCCRCRGWGRGRGLAEVGFEVDAHPRSLCWARRAPTEGAVRETVDELEVTGDGEDVEEVEEDVHGQDGYHTESCLGPDAPQLALWPHGLHLAHLRGRQVSERGGQPCLREEPCLNGESPTVWGPLRVRGDAASSRLPRVWRPGPSGSCEGFTTRHGEGKGLSPVLGAHRVSVPSPERGSDQRS